MASMITTVDNPYDPRTQFDEWYMWDTGQGYNTSGYLARVAAISDEFPDAIKDRQIEDAIDEIIAMHGGEMYKKLKIEEDETSTEETPSPSATAVA